MTVTATMTMTDLITETEFRDWGRRRDAVRLLPRRVRVLYATACAWRVLPLFERGYPTDCRSRTAIETAEGWVFGRATAAASYAAAAASYAAAAASYAAAAAYYAADAATTCILWPWLHRVYCRAVGPGRAFDSAWRSDTTVALAKGMSESRDFSVMPILADALEDAGCGEAEVLHTLRHEPDTHSLSDWAVWGVLDLGGTP